jgi:hypothetical protein
VPASDYAKSSGDHNPLGENVVEAGTADCNWT